MKKRVNIFGVIVKRMGPGSCQGCLPDTSHKLKPMNIHLNMGKSFFILRVTKHWNRLPREVVESPSLEGFKRHLDLVLDDVV